MTKTVHICPLCKRESLVSHCENGLCGWSICRNKDCDAMLDPRRRRGHKVNPDPKLPRVRVRLLNGVWEVAA